MYVCVSGLISDDSQKAQRVREESGPHNNAPAQTAVTGVVGVAEDAESKKSLPQQAINKINIIDGLWMWGSNHTTRYVIICPSKACVYRGWPLTAVDFFYSSDNETLG